MDEEYEVFQIDWKGQGITVKWCAEWMGGFTAHLIIQSDDGQPTPISETGYKSHFIQREVVEDAGGPVKYTCSWLEQKDDGTSAQLSLF